MRKTNGKLTQEQIIKKFLEKHGDKYDYSLVEYVNIDTKVKVVCPKHGVFQQIPYTHLKSYGCEKCTYEIRAKRATFTTNTFIEKAKLKHGDRYKYHRCDYVNSKTKVEIECSVHGAFLQLPAEHLTGKGCKKCAMLINIESRRCNQNELIEQAQIIHNNQYDYSKVEYKTMIGPVIITCSEHGEFLQSFNNHIKHKQGCPKCGKYTSYMRSTYVERCKNGRANLYLLRCFNEEEVFFKVGITNRDLKRRYKNKTDMPYEFIVHKFANNDAGKIWDTEKKINKILKEFAYTPKIDFGGSKTECFSFISKDVEKIFDDLTAR